MFKNITKLVFLLLISLSGVANLHAQDQWPRRPITIIVPYPPGGSLDAIVRPFALAMQQHLGQPVIIDNKPGANEAIGVQALLRAPADGYTFFAATDSALILNPLLNSQIQYKPQQDFVAISQLADVPMVFAVPASSPANSMKMFIDLARRSGESRQELSYGSTGVGGPLHLALASFTHDQQIKMTHVPYKGAAEMLKDMASGLIDAGVAGAASVKPFIDGKKIKPLAVSSVNRLPTLPDVPTLKEVGVADFGAGFFIGLVSRSGTSNEVIEAVGKAVKASAADNQLKERLDHLGAVTVGSTPQEFGALIKNKYTAQQARLKNLKIDMR